MSGGEKEVAQLRVLQLVNEAENLTTLDVQKQLDWSNDFTVGITKSLEMMGKVKTCQITLVEWNVTNEGIEAIEHGSPEWRVLDLVKASAVPVSAELLRKGTWEKAGLNTAVKNGWVKVESGCVCVGDIEPLSDSIAETVRRVKELGGVTERIEDEKVATLSDLQHLARRKMVEKVVRNYFRIDKADNFSLQLEKYETDLNRDILLKGSWRKAQFKPYNFDAAGIYPKAGSVHPLIGTMNMFRNILIQMRFEEMPTMRWVESSFWNFDALFQPQTHPVRDAHDTFFMKDPAAHPIPKGSEVHPDEAYFNRVRNMHEHGDEASLGWQCHWDPREACKLLMRTHTTAVSSQMLRMMGQRYQETKVFEAQRFFSIDRVFRNETLDATHLSEFHQVEGVVADKDVSLADLMGFIRTFFARIGITDVRFKPAYNPYTEPSMEIFGYHPELDRWTEIGNSGVFRPEMLKPMGLPEGVNVLGWGLSLERPTMIAQGLKDIRELFGPKAKLSVF